MFGNNDKIERIYINFCNPWPKTKHNKRRLTYPLKLKMYKEFLIDEGEIYFKTDDDELFECTLVYFEQENFDIVSLTYDLDKDDIFKNNIETEHEKIFKKDNLKIKALIAKRRKE